MSPSNNISPDSVVKASTEQVSCELDGEAVILNLADGVYYSLNTVAARIWELIETPKSVRDICAVIGEEYDVQEEQCLTEVKELLHELEGWALIDVTDAQEVD